MERMVNGRFQRAVGMTASEAFHSGAQVDRGLVKKRLAAKREVNVTRKELRGAELCEGNQVWVHVPENVDRGPLRKLDARWGGPYVLGKQISPSS